MPISYETPKNSSSLEPSEEKGGSFASAAGTHPVSTNPSAPHQGNLSPEQAEAANSAPPDTLGGLVDPDIATMEDGT